jgi:hypothetical protein
MLKVQAVPHEASVALEFMTDHTVEADEMRLQFLDFDRAAEVRVLDEPGWFAVCWGSGRLCRGRLAEYGTIAESLSQLAFPAGRGFSFSGGSQTSDFPGGLSRPAGAACLYRPWLRAPCELLGPHLERLHRAVTLLRLHDVLTQLSLPTPSKATASS